MPPFLFRITSFLSYWLNAVDEHSLHSPFFFDLYTKVIKPRPVAGSYAGIEALRKQLLHDHRVISVQDLGAGAGRQTTRRISAIARTSLSRRRYSVIYAGLAKSVGARTIIELGTSFGINTLYLAESPEAAVTTFEGAPAIADIASLTFEFAEKQNIELITGPIDRTLPDFLQLVRKVDFALVDANHRYEPTVRYCEWLLKKVHTQSVVVIDDIHYSREMQAAWETLKHHRLVYASADLHQCGVLFFDPSLNKQHVILQV